jgi:hypothetical protein
MQGEGRPLPGKEEEQGNVCLTHSHRWQSSQSLFGLRSDGGAQVVGRRLLIQSSPKYLGTGGVSKV